ncbi:hypothetical protein SAMN05421766_104225 [Zobellia uliginosa]|uniref:Glycosyl hydrolases family 43 n=1 Tax=Zobellia uliginosa TaxID=143224 RepID=A0ABY1KVZ4_9FLAO|nr:hypothetical protein [Zobellia uliginosa]SIS83047.1 hypothetical protein SAMN05421766_104225 [Zobellia uliginosa]
MGRNQKSNRAGAPKKGMLYPISLLTTALFVLSSRKQTSKNAIKKQETDTPLKSVRFTYQEVKDIGKDSLFNRRDNSDIIQVNGRYSVRYTKMESPQTAGYWGSIRYATSVDKGLTWKEEGMHWG